MFYVRNLRNTTTDSMDKMQSYFSYTRYQAAYITRVFATLTFKELINCPKFFRHSSMFTWTCATGGI
jgi:hypothetical protein